MEKLTLKNGLVNWRQNENLRIESIEKLDDSSIHIEFNNFSTVLFLVKETELNGVVCYDSEELINKLTN